MGLLTPPERQAAELADWLRAHRAEFVPLRVRDARATARPATDGHPVVDLTVQLDAPTDRDAGWPAAALFGLIEAVNRESRRRHPGLYVYVLPQAVGDGAA